MSICVNLRNLRNLCSRTPCLRGEFSDGSSRRRGGFSLVEVLCAVLILGFGLVGLGEGITLALRSSKESERITVAAGLAAERIEVLRAEGYLMAGEDEGDFGVDFPLFGWRQTVVAAADLDGLYEVTVAVRLAKTGEDVFELKTLLFDMPFGSLRSSAAKEKETEKAEKSGAREGRGPSPDAGALRRIREGRAP